MIESYIQIGKAEYFKIFVSAVSRIKPYHAYRKVATNVHAFRRHRGINGGHERKYVVLDIN